MRTLSWGRERGQSLSRCYGHQRDAVSFGRSVADRGSKPTVRVPVGALYLRVGSRGDSWFMRCFMVCFFV